MSRQARIYKKASVMFPRWMTKTLGVFQSPGLFHMPIKDTCMVTGVRYISTCKLTVQLRQYSVNKGHARCRKLCSLNLHDSSFCLFNTWDQSEIRKHIDSVLHSTKCVTAPVYCKKILKSHLGFQTAFKQLSSGCFHADRQLIRRCYSSRADNSDEQESWEMLVDLRKLSQLEKRIHERHLKAVKKKELMYIDPQTGYYVMTRLAHVQRGECCGNACRHCPFGQVNVKEECMKKVFNSAFYV